MGTTLHTLAPNPGATRKKKRIGRGPGSGTGKTAGKGTKGQKARTGHHGARIGFEGGQMPMQRRLPKRGFHNPFREEAYPINLGMLERHFQAGGVVDLDALRGVGLVPKRARIVKILAGGELTAKLTVKAHRFSQSAIAKLESLGGTAEVLALPAAHLSSRERRRGGGEAKVGA
jgi:large subunit ribosomal protein L15